MATSKSVHWPVCERCAEGGGIGVRLPNGGDCWAHAQEQDLDAALQQLGEDGRLDARSVTITAVLLQRLLTAASHDDTGHAILTDARFYWATFQGEARFDEATFQGDTRFTGATFQGDAWFQGVTFQGKVSFDEATFQGAAQFGMGSTYDHPGSAVRRYTGVVAALILQVSVAGMVGSGPTSSEV